MKSTHYVWLMDLSFYILLILIDKTLSKVIILSKFSFQMDSFIQVSNEIMKQYLHFQFSLLFTNLRIPLNQELTFYYPYLKFH